MGKKERILKVFFSAPTDLSEEKRIFCEIIRKINNIKAKKLNSKFVIVSIDQEQCKFSSQTGEEVSSVISECDLFIFGLWKSWNLCEGKTLSPVEKHYQHAKLWLEERGKPFIASYFRCLPENMMADPGNQLRKILDFRTNIESSKKLLYFNYDTPVEFSNFLYEFLCNYLEGKGYSDSLNEESTRKRVVIPDDIVQKINAISKEYENIQNPEQKELNKLAVQYALDAFSCIRDYKFTLAQECFIKSLGIVENPYILNAYGIMLTQLGCYVLAEEKFNRILEISGNYGEDLLLKSYAYNNLGNLYDALDDMNEAYKMYSKALEIDLRLNRVDGIVSNYNNLGIIHRKQNEFSKAERMYKKALDANLFPEHTQAMASTFGNLGNIYLLQNKFDKAEQMYKKALDIDMELWCKDEIVADCFNLGNVYTKRGDFLNAEQMYDKSMELSRENWIKKEIASSYCYLASRYAGEGNLDKSECLYTKALDISRKLESSKGMASIYLNLGILYEYRGNIGKTKELWYKSEEYFIQSGNEKEAKKIRTWIRDLQTDE